MTVSTSPAAPRAELFRASTPAILALADGTVFRGRAIGAMGHAVWTYAAPEGAVNAAVTLSVAFLKPVRGEGQTLTIEGRVVQRGKRLCFTEAVATDENGTAVARATGTHALLKRDTA